MRQLRRESPQVSPPSLQVPSLQVSGLQVASLQVSGLPCTRTRIADKSREQVNAMRTLFSVYRSCLLIVDQLGTSAGINCTPPSGASAIRHPSRM